MITHSKVYHAIAITKENRDAFHRARALNLLLRNLKTNLRQVLAPRRRGLAYLSAQIHLQLPQNRHAPERSDHPRTVIAEERSAKGRSAEEQRG